MVLVLIDRERPILARRRHRPTCDSLAVVPSRLVGALVGLALLVAACGGSSPGGSSPGETSPGPSGSPAGRPSVIPVIVSVEQAVGPDRFLFSLLDPEANRPVAAPDRPVSVVFRDPSGRAGQPVEATFMWAIEDERGVYVVNPTFDAAGTWAADFTVPGASGAAETIRVDFDVREDRATVALGEKAPSVKTPVLADVGGDVAKVSTDTDPVPAFYEHSVDELLAAGRPFVLAFATPKFCTSAQCGPTLERLKAVAASRPDIAVVNVEPYELEYADGALQARRTAEGQLQAVPATREYGLLTEPWIFVVDGSGTVTGSFETIFSEDELLAAIDAATK